MRWISIEEGERLLKQGEVVAVPAETVYGLAASIAHPRALRQIFTLKGRSLQNPLIVHVASLTEAQKYVEIPNNLAIELTKIWPGPLTLVAPLKTTVPIEITAGLKTLAIRVPSHPVFLELIRRVGPLAAPSANRSGLPSATRAWHIETDYEGKIPIVEGEAPECGVESTILILKGNTLEVGRLGAVPIDHLKERFVIQSGETVSHTPNCPGKLLKHYAPLCQLTTEWSECVEAIVGFPNVLYPLNRPLYDLGSQQNPQTIADRLFETLRCLDRDQIKLAFVDTNFPNYGLYATIQERLTRALQAQKET